jgi:hypothetical protein
MRASRDGRSGCELPHRCSGGLQATASEVEDFDLPSVPGHGGSVMRFPNPEAYDAAVAAFAAMAALAGPHRYGSRKALIFVQMNEGASADIGAKARAAVDAL